MYSSEKKLERVEGVIVDIRPTTSKILTAAIGRMEMCLEEKFAERRKDRLKKSEQEEESRAKLNTNLKWIKRKKDVLTRSLPRAARS